MSASRTRAAPSSAAPTIYQRLSQAGAALDDLARDVSLGVRDQNHFDALEERASQIAGSVRSAFRANG